MSTKRKPKGAAFWRKLYLQERRRTRQLEKQRHRDLIRRLDKAQRSMDTVVLPGLAQMAADFERWQHE